jgi:hypothetical protein
MDIEKKIVKFDTHDGIEDNDTLRDGLAKAMLENKRMKRIVDIFILVLFLILIMYTSI